MAKLAIDVVLLPSKEIIDRTIEFNKTLKNRSIALNKTTCVPHISLCMGVINSRDLKKISKILENISSNFSNDSLTINSYRDYPIEGSDPLYGFSITSSKALSDLQRKIMVELWPFLSYDINPKIFYIKLVFHKHLY